MQNAAKTYIQTQVGTTSQGDILILLFDGAIKFLNQAKERMAEKNYAQKGILISKALDILTELQGSLNANKGGDLAANLQRLYFYCSTQLLTANLKMDVGKVDEVLHILSGLRDAFSQANAMAGMNPEAALKAQAAQGGLTPPVPPAFVKAAAPAQAAPGADKAQAQPAGPKAAAPSAQAAPAAPAKPAFNVYAIPKRAPAAQPASQPAAQPAAHTQAFPASPAQGAPVKPAQPAPPAPSVQPAQAARPAPAVPAAPVARPAPTLRQPGPANAQPQPATPLSPVSGAAKKAFAAYAGAQKNVTGG